MFHSNIDSHLISGSGFIQTRNKYVFWSYNIFQMNSKVYKSYPQIELLHFPQVSTQTVTRIEKTQSSIDLSVHSNNFEEEGTMAQYPNYKATTVCQNWLDFSTLMFDGSTVSLMWQYKNFSQSIINFYTKGEIHSIVNKISFVKHILFMNTYIHEDFNRIHC